MSGSAWSMIPRLRQAREPLAWWQRELGSAFDVFRPFLIPCKGLAGHTYPCPDTGLRLQVRATNGRYLAYPTGDDAEDAMDRPLTWDDVQAWRLDHDGLRLGVAKALELRAGSEGGSHEDIQLVGFCDRHGRRKRVYMCYADGSATAVRMAADTARTPEAGCLVFPARHTGTDHVLKARGVAMVVMAECLGTEGGRLTCDCGMACRAVEPDISNTQLKTHIDGRFDTLGRTVASLEEENARLKQDLAQVLSNVAQKVEPEFFQWVFAILGAGSVNAAAKRLGVAGSTFSDRVKEYVGRGGLYKTLYSMVAVRKKGAGRKQIERFNELFSEHQGAQVVAQPDVLRELLDGLEALNAANWKGMRDELIAIVRGELPEG